MADDPDLDVLFTTPPERFVAVRSELAQKAKESGRADLAIRLKALRKPSVVTWLVNSLVRRHRDRVELVLREGKALRDAYSLGDRNAIREATRRRHRALGDAIRLAREVLRQSGGRKVDEPRLAATLLGASLDENAGKRLLRGTLDREIEPPAFESVMDAALAPVSKRAHPAGGVTAKRAAKARRASEAAAARQSKLRRSRLEALRRKMKSAERAAARAEATARRLGETATRARARAESAHASAAEARKIADQLRDELASTENNR